jgi:hypothetical protein
MYESEIRKNQAIQIACEVGKAFFGTGEDDSTEGVQIW